LCASVISASAGIQGELGPGVQRGNEIVPFGKNFREILSQSVLVLIGAKGLKKKPQYKNDDHKRR